MIHSEFTSQLWGQAQNATPDTDKKPLQCIICQQPLRHIHYQNTTSNAHQNLELNPSIQAISSEDLTVLDKFLGLSIRADWYLVILVLFQLLISWSGCKSSAASFAHLGGATGGVLLWWIQRTQRVSKSSVPN